MPCTFELLLTGWFDRIVLALFVSCRYWNTMAGGTRCAAERLTLPLLALRS